MYWYFVKLEADPGSQKFSRWFLGLKTHGTTILGLVNLYLFRLGHIYLCKVQPDSDDLPFTTAANQLKLGGAVFET